MFPRSSNNKNSTKPSSSSRHENRFCVKSFIPQIMSSNFRSLFVVSTLLYCIVAMIILPSSSSAVVVPQPVSEHGHYDPYSEEIAIDANENALKMLRNYFKGLHSPYQPEHDAADYPNYFTIDDLKSNKRGLGPRPLRFGRK